MPSGKYRSRRFARKRVRIPGNKNVLHYSKKKTGKAHCNKCGALLGGVPCVRDSKRRNLSKSKKRPNRPFAGNLCSRCVKSMVKTSIHTQ
ncbi:MAG: 50S ribosomal protein L34e [Promethearchaeota archaeon]